MVYVVVNGRYEDTRNVFATSNFDKAIQKSLDSKGDLKYLEVWYLGETILKFGELTVHESDKVRTFEELKAYIRSLIVESLNKKIK